MKALVFGGTTEGRVFSQWLLARGIDTTVCVATEYGGTLLSHGADVRVGRLNQTDMEGLMAQGYTLVVDATHPYAAVVTTTIQSATQAVGLPYYRLLRDGDPEGDWIEADSVSHASALCRELTGNILLTTGSKELAPFSTEALVHRTYPRVLPTLDSLQRCLDFGFDVGRILCMQGPFSQALNAALLQQFDIQILVTKASGMTGGFWEKVAAAQACHAKLIVIHRPLQETGYTLEALQGLAIFN
ncbi:precorrin-6A reductase [Bengtsoniella intestinalis]|uniref:precorrin-6A reductase n=1 Tax=Bengtsoniella intestinalis TaxID=3073143 RepID=UPI00391FBBF3